MLTDLDTELFPDNCEVVEIPPHNLYVYLIQKNGSSSLRDDAQKNGWQILRNSELHDLKTIDIYLRDPVQRYLSGVNTFVQHLLRDQPGLDRHTCEIMATRYLFLNRHYVPQWHWLVNLARFISPHCQIRLNNLEDMSRITSQHSSAGIDRLPDHVQTRWLAQRQKLEFWFFVDRILLGRCGQSLTWFDIKQIYRDHPAQPMLTLLDRMQALQHVLS